MARKFNDLTIQSHPDADRFHEELKKYRYDFATGVPCGVLKYFIANFERDKSFTHVKAQNEPEAIGIAAGAYLGGKKPVVYMQNSGLLKSTNEIGSLLLPYKIPVLGLVTYRGAPGEDAPQHMITGMITTDVLEAMEITYMELCGEHGPDLIRYASYWQDEKKSTILLIKRGWSQKKGKTRKIQAADSVKEINRDGLHIEDLRKEGEKLEREEALDAIIGASTRKDAVFSTTGLISRSLYERHDSPNQFYNTGSFGMVSSEGLGFALAKPSVKTIIVDGDASVLTNFGTLVTIGQYQPKNLVHIVIDNQAYGSCSEEKTLSTDLNIAKTAYIHGYRNVITVNSYDALYEEVKNSEKGPTLIQAKIELGGRRDLKRPLDLEYIASRFKKHFSK